MWVEVQLSKLPPNTEITRFDGIAHGDFFHKNLVLKVLQLLKNVDLVNSDNKIILPSIVTWIFCNPQV